MKPMAASFRIHNAIPKTPASSPKKMLRATNASAAKMAKPKMLRNMGVNLRGAPTRGPYDGIWQPVSGGRQHVSGADVAVIGGGAIGAACARAAALRGLAVAIFEPGPDPAAASPASAGMLAPQIEPPDDALVALSVRGRDLYEPLAPALRETTGIDIGFWRSGIAAVAFDEPGAVRLKEEVARQRQAGLRCDWLEADEVRERWPGAAPECQGALFAPEDGALDPQALTRACLSDARRLGAALHAEPVESIQVAQGRVTGVVTAAGPPPPTAGRSWGATPMSSGCGTPPATAGTASCSRRSRERSSRTSSPRARPTSRSHRSASTAFRSRKTQAVSRKPRA